MAFRSLLACLLCLATADVFLTSVRSSFSRANNGMLVIYLCLAAHETVIILEAATLCGFVSQTYWVSAGFVKEIAYLLKVCFPLWVVRLFLAAFPCLYRDVMVSRHGYRRSWDDAGYGVLVVLDIVILIIYTLSCVHVVSYLSEKSLYAPYHHRVGKPPSSSSAPARQEGGAAAGGSIGGDGGHYHGGAATTTSLFAPFSGTRRGTRHGASFSVPNITTSMPQQQHHHAAAHDVPPSSTGLPPLELKYRFTPDAMEDPTLGLFASAVARAQLGGGGGGGGGSNTLESSVEIASRRPRSRRASATALSPAHLSHPPMVPSRRKISSALHGGGGGGPFLSLTAAGEGGSADGGAVFEIDKQTGLVVPAATTGSASPSPASGERHTRSNASAVTASYDGMVSATASAMRKASKVDLHLMRPAGTAAAATAEENVSSSNNNNNNSNNAGPGSLPPRSAPRVWFASDAGGGGGGGGGSAERAAARGGGGGATVHSPTEDGKSSFNPLQL